ncbi:hypothetical protein [Saccharothrix australiensis]|uniref:Uncharacterized protein n=1 Tax=Saccharothrix australiensis TaxID=2072 RepID=A0A495W5D4_9PSEU|nr:hypothetical protein [Saccharothrix australiensis]RKT56267.1 hypothetical protein C8E97_4960 [Saccharothrix australiensis]
MTRGRGRRPWRGTAVVARRGRWPLRRSFLWLHWLDQSTRVQKPAAYPGAELAPRATAAAGRPVLGRESYLGQLNERRLSLRTPRGDDPPAGASGIVRPWRADWHTPLLFGLTPLLLTGFHVAANIRHPGTPAPIRLAAVGCALALWVFSLTRFADFPRDAKAVEQAILAAAVCGPLSPQRGGDRR